MYTHKYVYTYITFDAHVKQQLRFKVLHTAHFIHRPSTSVPAAMAETFFPHGMYQCVQDGDPNYVDEEGVPFRWCSICTVYEPFAPVSLDTCLKVLNTPCIYESEPQPAGSLAASNARALLSLASGCSCSASSPLAGPYIPLPRERVKFSFLHMNLHPHHLNELLHIEVSESRRLRVNGGPWHGGADYGHTRGAGGHWTLLFNCKADISKLKSTKYIQIPGTKSFLHVKKGDAAYNSMLIPKEYENTPLLAHMCSPVCGAPLRQQLRHAQRSSASR